MVVSILIFSIFSPIPASADVRTVTIAYQGPLSGPEAERGLNQLNGVRFAVHYFNRLFQGLIEVKIETFDDQGDPSEALKVAPLIAQNSNLLGVVGPAFSVSSITSIPFYKQLNMPVISPSASRDILTDPVGGKIGYPIFHRIASPDRKQGSFLLDFATLDVLNPRIFVIDDQSPYGMELSKNIRSTTKLWTIGYDSVPHTTSDWSPQIAKAKAISANVVIFTGYYPQAVTLFKQIRDSGYTGILAGGDGVFDRQILSLIDPSLIEGTRLIGRTTSLNEFNLDLENNFRSVIGNSSGLFTAESIDATNVFLYCIAKGADTRALVLKCIDSFQGKSINGQNFSFDENGDSTLTPGYGYVIRSGNFKLMDYTLRYGQSSGEIIASFPWYSVLKESSEAEAKAKAEAEAKAKAEAEAKAKAEAEAKAKAKAEAEAKLLTAMKESCIQFNNNLMGLLTTNLRSSLMYPNSSKLFEDLTQLAPVQLNCTNIDIYNYLGDLQRSQQNLKLFEAKLNLAIANSLMNSKKINSITCTKGKTIKRISGLNPKCPSGFRKKAA